MYSIVYLSHKKLQTNKTAKFYLNRSVEMKRNAKQKILSVCLTGATLCGTVAGIMLTPASAAEYQDIESHWGKSAIQQVTDWGLFNGVGDSVFAPDAEMTRGMFVTVLVRTAQHLETYKEPAQQASFADVTQTDYFANGVAWAQENGVVTGVDAEHFAPNDQITREQMCVIMTRYLANFTDCDLSVNQKNEATFLDQTSIQDYAAQSVDVCLALGLVTGVPTSDGMEFQPAQPASRETASSRVISKKLPHSRARRAPDIVPKATRTTAQPDPTRHRMLQIPFNGGK